MIMAVHYKRHKLVAEHLLLKAPGRQAACVLLMLATGHIQLTQEIPGLKSPKSTRGTNIIMLYDRLSVLQQSHCVPRSMPRM